jgi:hypothetical protein
MHLIGLMPARNEEWIIGLSARAALMWLDELVVLDHCSSDRTPEILAEIQREHPGRLTVIEDKVPVWYEMAHRQRLLECARTHGASHLALVDADEVLTGNQIATVRSGIEAAPVGEVMQLAWLCMWRTPVSYVAVSSHWAHAWVSFAFQDQRTFHWTTRNGYDFHHRHPMNSEYKDYRPIPRTDGGLMHLQFTVWPRLLAKQALYKMTEVVRWPGRDSIAAINTRYDRATSGDGIQTAVAPTAWWEPYQEWMHYLNLDPHAEVWQAVECRRLMAEHGRAKFAGLDLYGVC